MFTEATLSVLKLPHLPIREGHWYSAENVCSAHVHVTLIMLITRGRLRLSIDIWPQRMAAKIWPMRHSEKEN